MKATLPLPRNNQQIVNDRVAGGSMSRPATVASCAGLPIAKQSTAGAATSLIYVF